MAFPKKVQIGPGSVILLLSDHTVYRFALDADSCVFNEIYTNLKDERDDEEALHTACEGLYQFILAVVNASEQKEIVVEIAPFSSRTCPLGDFHNAEKFDTPLFLRFALPLIYKRITELPFAKPLIIRFVLDKETIYDILKNKPEGTGFDSDDLTMNCPYETDKVFLTYAGAHHSAKRYPADDVGVFLVDDYPPIINKVIKFLNDKRIQQNLPEKVTHYVTHFGDEETNDVFGHHPDGTPIYSAACMGVVSPRAVLKGVQVGSDPFYQSTLRSLYQQVPKEPTGSVKNLVDFLISAPSDVIGEIRQRKAQLKGAAEKPDASTRGIHQQLKIPVGQHLSVAGPAQPVDAKSESTDLDESDEMVTPAEPSSAMSDLDDSLRQIRLGT